MCARAAFVSACRAATAASSQPQVDLGLSGPSRPCPVAFDGGVTEAPDGIPDLSVTTPLSAQEVLVPAPSVSSDQESFSRQLFVSL